MGRKGELSIWNGLDASNGNATWPHWPVSRAGQIISVFFSLVRVCWRRAGSQVQGSAAF